MSFVTELNIYNRRVSARWYYVQIHQRKNNNTHQLNTA